MSSTETLPQDDLKDQSILDLTENHKDNQGCSKFKRKPNRSLVKYVVFSVFTGYFIWATYHNVKVNNMDFTTVGYTACNGYGLLVILYSFYIYGLLYVYFLKPRILPTLEKLIWNPATKCLSGIRYGSTIFYVSVLVLTLAYLIVDTKNNRSRLIPVSGMIVFLLIGYICSSNRSKINWRTVLWGIILQFVFGLITIRWAVGRNILECLGHKVDTLLNYANLGATFTYGEDLITKQQVFAFRALSSIYFLSFLVNILYFYGVMQKFIRMVGEFLQWIMGTSVCESVNSASNIFLGMSESPILIAPYLKNLTDSELHSIMTSGFATVAGSVMAAYIGFGARPEDLITSTMMSAPAALCFSKLMYPETEEVRVKKENIAEIEKEYDTVLDAATNGALIGIQLVQGIIASIIAFLACVYLINGVLGWCGELIGYSDPVWTLELISGKIFIPVSYVMGVPWEECESVGTLIGLKTMANEFVAFQNMKTMMDKGILSPRTKVIATYAICGFSNPGSVGITISTLGSLVPTKREVVTRLVFRAFVGGALVCFMTACIAGTLMPDDVVM